MGHFKQFAKCLDKVSAGFEKSQSLSKVCYFFTSNGNFLTSEKNMDF